MSIQNAIFMGDSALEDVASFVQDTPPEALLICAKSADTLSRITVRLVRRLRGSQGRIEFHQPSSPEAMLQAVNRLMQDVPIDQLSATHPGDGCRMLIVEQAENASEDEVFALRRLASALRGSAFQLVVLAQTTVAPVDHPTLCHLVSQAAVWLVDFSVGFDRFESASSVVSRRGAMQAAVTEQAPAPAPVIRPESAPLATPAKSKKNFLQRPPANNRELADILMQLAEERDKPRKD